MTYRAKKQNGVALLLALGFLSLLLVMGIAFVTNSTVARKAAANSRARAQAKTLAQSAVNRLLAEIRYVLKHPDDGYVAPSGMTSAGNGTFTVDNDTEKTLKGDNSLLSAYVYGEKFIPENIYKTDDTRPKWEFWYDLYNSDGTKHEDAAIIGRTAFMALSATASVNLSEVLRGASFSPETGSWSRWNARRGASMRELYLNIDFITSALYNRFKDERFANTILGQDSPTTATKADNYPDYDAIFSAANLTDPDKRNWLQSWILPGGYNEPEIFAFNTDSTTTTGFNDKTDFFHRFNLVRRTTDDKSVWDDDAGSDRVTVEALLGTPRKFDAKELAPNPSTALSWLKCIKGDAATHVGLYTPEVLRKQVAANLIDYCDADGKPTSDSTDWETTAPTYTGNEKTPYINEIMISPSISISRQEIPGDTGGETPEPTYSYKYTGEIGLRMAAAEVVNMYEAAFPNLDMSLSGEYTVEVSADSGKGSETLRTQTVKVSFTIPLKTLSAWDASGRYATKVLYLDGAPAEVTVATDPADGWKTFTTEPSKTQLDSKLNVSAKITSLKISKIHLKSPDGSIDYVRDLEFAPGDSATSELTAETLAANSTVTLYPHIGCEVDDPRANLYQGSTSDERAMNWKFIAVAAAQGTATTAPPTDFNTDAAFSFGSINHFCKPENNDATLRDIETATEPENVSTAFIANKPMRILTELGVIHRGEKWRTINLKCSSSRIWHTAYDPRRSMSETSGYTYADGDAAILDQVKLTKDVFTAGKVNLNRYPAEKAKNYLFTALFEKIAWNVQTPRQYAAKDPDDSSDDVPDIDDYRVTSSQASALRDKLGGSERTGINQNLLSRGHMVDFLKDTAGFLQGSTDVQKETIPAVSSGLTSSYVSNPDIIQFVVVAQSIQDVGTKDGVDMSKLPESGNALVEMKVKKGQFDYKDKVYFDEITGEVKMLVTVQINALEQTVKLLKTEFLN